MRDARGVMNSSQYSRDLDSSHGPAMPNRRNFFIDLVQWLDPESTGRPYPALNHIGINRLAFRVSNIDATTAALRERGITFLSQEPQSFGPIRTIVTTDPDGIFIQLLEWRSGQTAK